MLTRTRKFDHITPVLKSLHWLPIRSRIKYKLLLTWKALHDMAPSYISELIKYRKSPHPMKTKSANKRFLEVPRTLNSYGKRAFYSSSPELWNSLPVDLRLCDSLDTFKKTLKTHLFKLAYVD